MVRRYGLRDDQWERIKELRPGRVGHVGVTAKDNRLFVDGRAVPLSSGHSLAGSAGALRAVEGGAHALHALGQKRRLGDALPAFG